MGNITKSSKLPKENRPPRELFKHSNIISSQSVCALFDYESSHGDELSFRRGDEINAFIIKDKDWWWARHKTTNKYGYIPRNFVVIIEGKDGIGRKCLEAWWEIDKLEANSKLMSKEVYGGTYLLRPSSDHQYLVLSVCYIDKIKTIKHYKIDFKDGYYFINENKRFINLNELIQNYSENADGLCCRLKGPLRNQGSIKCGFQSVTIARSQLKLGKLIGKGHYGEVYEATLGNRINVAIKVLHNQDCNRKKFLQEAESLHRLRHERIVKLIGICTIPISEPVYIVTELMKYGSLKDYLNKLKNKTTAVAYSCTGYPITLKYIIHLLINISEGMMYLESMNFIHRDLRAANILLANDWSAKVADFGLAKMLDDIYLPSGGYDFPIRWTALEVLTEDKFCIRSDVWSFGILMYEIITLGETPYTGFSINKVLEYVKEGGILNQPVNCPDKYYRTMVNCWQKHRLRPSFVDLNSLFSDWIKSFY